ncbi:MAG: arginine--tRNA ligase, partial [Pseudomonadota bacterium]
RGVEIHAVQRIRGLARDTRGLHELKTFGDPVGLKEAAVIPADHKVKLHFERARQAVHGDFATNVALSLAKAAGKNPRELAELIVASLPTSDLIRQTEIAGPGFINIFLNDEAKFDVLKAIFTAGDSYGLAAPNSGQKIMVEFVSANPTGPLHVGHGRGAVYGDALARLLSAAGHRVEREYYVNDAGRQMDILATSVWIRYAQCAGSNIALPENCYQGDYVAQYGQELFAEHGEVYLFDEAAIDQATEGLESEAALDATIKKVKETLGEVGFKLFFDKALNTILADIKDDLSGFGIDFDTWFSEKSLFDSGKIFAAIERLKSSGDVYEKGGAWWFKTTAYGDEKDRVVVRDNGQPTYFASDIAYHFDKLDRGFDLAINIWGADHHGYIARVKAGMQGLGLDPEQLKVLLVQFAVLYRGGEKLAMGTRSGNFVALRELRDEIGSDAARFFYTQRKSEQHMDFDLDLAKAQSNENPMYYVQYAHARICRLLTTAQERDIEFSQPAEADFSLLASEKEESLLKELAKFPELVMSAANQYEPHQITFYLRELATNFHSWYNTEKFLELDEDIRNAKLALSQAVRQVLQNGLGIIGVAAPESM